MALRLLILVFYASGLRMVYTSRGYDPAER